MASPGLAGVARFDSAPGRDWPTGRLEREREMSSTKAMSGTLYGCHWERHGWGVLVYAFDGGDTFRGYVTSRRYVGNGSDRVTVRGSVLAFRREMGVAR